jgi:hypothetical protein
MMSGLLTFLPLLLTILKGTPKALKMIKAGVVTINEVSKLVKWFFKHKEAGAKTLYVVPQELVKKPELETVKLITTTVIEPTPVPSADLQAIINYRTDDVPDYLKKYIE